MTRKLITWPLLRTLGLYVGACWVAVEFADWLVGRYSLPDRVVDFTLIGLLSFLPTVALLARNHGEPGPQQWTRTEMIFIPANMALSATVLTALLLSGPPTSPQDAIPVRTVTVTEPSGEALTRPLVPAALSRGLTMFFFDNDTGDKALDWMQYGVTIALYADVSQNPFIKPWSPFVGWESYGMFKLRRAGFDDGLEVPVALKRTIAADGLMEYFVGGRLERADDGESIDVVTLLYDTSSSRVVRELRANAGPGGENLLAAIDTITTELTASLELPEDDDTLVDLPTADRLTTSIEAFELHTHGAVAKLIHSDRDSAVSFWREAVTLDPTFALAYWAMGQSLFESGLMQDGGLAVQSALRHDYKLNDRERFIAKGMNYVFRGDRDKEAATYQTWTELKPDDSMAFIYLASSQLYGQNDVTGARASYERALEIDPREIWILSKIGYLHEVKGNREAALEYYTRHHEAAPDDSGPLSSLGALHRRGGDLARARAFFERAAIVARGLVDPTLALADLDLREGRYEQALARLDEASDIAATARQRAAVLRGRMKVQAQRGQETELLSLLPQLAEESEQFLPPIDVVMGVWVNFVEHYVTAGRADEAVEILRGHEAKMQPPLNSLIDVGYLIVSVAIGDPQAATSHGQAAGELLDTLGLDHMRSYTSYYSGRVYALRGDWDAAVESLELARRLYRDSIQRIQEEPYEYEILTYLSECYLEQGRLDEARDALDYVLARFPAHVTANLSMAKLHVLEGQPDAATPYLTTASSALTVADEGHPLQVATRDVVATLGI